MRLIYFGVHGAFSTVPLQALVRAGHAPQMVVLGKDRPVGRRPPRSELRRAGRKAKGDAAVQHDLQVAAHELGLDVMASWADDRKLLDAIERAEPDAYFVAGYPRLLSPPVLKLPTLGGLNLHPGRLPEERGAAPLYWALKEGRTDLAFTIHVLERGEDTGDIVVSDRVQIQPGMSGQAILRRIAESAVPHILRSVRALGAGDLVRMAQTKGSFEKKRRPRFVDGRIDPKKSAEEVFTFVAACAETYSIWAECAEDRFFIRRAVSYDSSVTNAPEWSLFSNRLLLACNPGVVELELKDDGVLFASEYTEEPASP